MGAVGAAPRFWALCIFAAAALLRRAALAQDLENPQPRLRLLALRCADRPIDLEPPFKPLKYVYMASIDFSEEEFSIDAIAEEGMEVTNMDDLVSAKLISPGTEHEVEVKVRNKRDLTDATYSIKVSRKDGRDVTLFNLDTPGSDFSPAFHAERFRYIVKVPADLDRLYMRFAPLDVGQTFEIKSLPPDFVAGQPQLWTPAPATLPPTTTVVEETTTTQGSAPDVRETTAPVGGHAFTEASTTTLAPTTTTPTPTTTQPPVLQCFEVDTWYASGPDRSPDMEGSRKETVEDEFDCQELCAKDKKCAWFSYWPDGACHLQDKDAVKATAAGPIAGPKRCQAPCFEKNIQYGPTPDMPHTERTSVKSALECQARCAAIQGCAHFTYWPDGGCHLQDKDAVAEVTMDSEVVAGPPDCMPTCLEKNTWYGPEKNMAGQVKSLEVTAGQCQARCAGAIGCAHFSFWPDGSCHLQDYAASPVTAEQGVVAGPPDCNIEGEKGMARRLHDVTIQNVGTVPSAPPGEHQYTVIERWFSIDAASSRLVTINVWAPNGDAHRNQTYRLQVSREQCPPHRPFFAPDTQACSATCNTGYFPNDEVLRCESCSPRCLVCAAWDDCQVCEASQWRVLHFVQRIGGHCHVFQIPWKNIGGSILAFMVLLGMICHCCMTCCSEHRPRKGNAFGVLPTRRRSKATADEAGGETDRLLADVAGEEEPRGDEAS